MRIREKAERFGWSAWTIEWLRTELDLVLAENPAIPTEPGGWWHQYVCPEHHTELMFDPLREDTGEYECPYGCRLTGEPYRGAWLVFRHQAMARYALQAAAVYAATGEERYGELGKRIIIQYAEQFPLYPVHPDAQPWMLKGRAFHQALTEAIWATTLLRAYLLLTDEGVSFADADAAIAQFLTMLEASMEQYHHILTVDRGQPENNYTAWLNAALSCVYAASGQRDKLLGLVECSGGLRHHLGIAIQPDGLEFEGSVYYHVFVLRAYMIASEMLERIGVDGYALRGEHGQSIEAMLDVLVGLADGNGKLPALHDGPYERMPYSREIAEVFEIGYAKFGKPQYLPLLKEAYRNIFFGNRTGGGAGERRGHLEALLYGEGEWSGDALVEDEDAGAANLPGSFMLEESGFAVLRRVDNPISCLLDFGPHGGSHGHYDKLNLMLHVDGLPLSPDRGTVPYGSELKKLWYPATASHNTVSVGGRSQEPVGGSCTAFVCDERGHAVTAKAGPVYEGSELLRHVLVADRFVIDWFQVRLAEENEIDWWFHFCGELETDESLWSESKDRSALGEADGYSYIRPLRELKGEAFASAAIGKRAELRLVMDEAAASRSIGVSVLAPADAALIHVHSPGLAIDPSVPMNGILLRSKGQAADYAAVYSADGRCLELNWEEAGTDAAGGMHEQRQAQEIGLGQTHSQDQQQICAHVLTVRDGASLRRFQLTNSGLKELTA